MWTQRTARSSPASPATTLSSSSRSRSRSGSILAEPTVGGRGAHEVARADQHEGEDGGGEREDRAHEQDGVEPVDHAQQGLRTAGVRGYVMSEDRAERGHARGDADLAKGGVDA